MRKIVYSVIVICIIAGGLAYAQAIKKDGIHKEYYRSGELKYKSRYEDGKLNGETVEYDKSGKVIGRYIFKNDDIVKVLKGGRTEKGEVHQTDFGITKKAVVIGISVVAGIALLLFILSKVVFKNKPF